MKYINICKESSNSSSFDQKSRLKLMKIILETTRWKPGDRSVIYSITSSQSKFVSIVLQVFSHDKSCDWTNFQDFSHHFYFLWFAVVVFLRIQHSHIDGNKRKKINFPKFNEYKVKIIKKKIWFVLLLFSWNNL